MSEKTETKPSYYAVIPANVRYDKTLPGKSGMLYGEVTALSNEKGYCWAGNEYFAELYGVNDKTISKWITALVKGGYIISERTYRKSTKTTERRLSLSHTANVAKMLPSPSEVAKTLRPREQKRSDQGNENATYNTTLNTTLNKNIKDMFSDYTVNKELSIALDDFLEMRMKLKKKPTENAIRLILQKLDKIATNDDEKIEILENSIMNSWAGIFPLKNQKAGGNDGTENAITIGSDGTKRDELGFRVY